MDPNKFGNTNADTPTSFADSQIQKMQQSPSFNAGEGAASTQEALGTITLGTPDQTVTSITVDEIDIPATRKVEQQANDPQAFFNTMAKEAAARGWTGSVSDYIKKKEQDLGYRGRTDIIETEFKDKIPGESRTVSAGSPGMAAFSKGLDDTTKLPKFTYNKKGSAPSGTADTFTSFDTRQAQRKAIVEARKQKRAKLKALRAKKRAGGIKDEFIEFGGFGPGFDGKTVTKSKKKVFKEAKRKIKQKAAEQRAAAMERISAQGELQRKQMKNPRISETMPMPSNGQKNRFKSSTSMSQLMADVKSGKAFNKN